jgi:hypothetical protein
MPAFNHYDAEVFERMAAELRRAAEELRQASRAAAGTAHAAPHPADELEAYAAAIVKDLRRAYG